MAIVAFAAPLLASAPAVFAATPTPTMTAPVASTTYGGHIPIAFSLPVAPLAGSVKLIFAGTSTSYDVTLSTSTAGATSFTLDNTNLPSNPQVASVTPNVTKMPDDTYTVILTYQDQAMDPAATAIASNVTLLTSAFFSTATSPTASQTNVSTTSPFVITFNRNVVVDGSAITIRRDSDNSTFATIPSNSAQVVTSGQQATITPTTALEAGTTYTVLVNAFAFQDLFGNVNAGFGFQFTTAAAVVPTSSTTGTTTTTAPNTGFGAPSSTGLLTLLTEIGSIVAFGTGLVLVRRSKHALN